MPELMQLINSSTNGSMLRNMALLDLSVPYCDIPENEHQVVQLLITITNTLQNIGN